MITVSSLTKKYVAHNTTFTALDNVNLTINACDIFGIIGKSGAGKSTLIRCINLLEKPNSGSITIDGTQINLLKPAELNKIRHKIGMVFQHFNLLNSRTVSENIALPLEIANASKTKILARTQELLSLVGVLNLADKYPTQLSGGQKQKVAIARALANRPRLLLCDEITSALDPESTQDILKLLRKINRELKITILMITHQMDVIKAICNQVAVIDAGKIVETSSALELFTAPKSLQAKKLIAASSRVEVPVNYQAGMAPHSLVTDTQLSETSGEHNMIIRIAYHGQTAHQPIIGYLMQQFNIIINILQGHMESVQDSTVGVLIVEARGTYDNIQKSIEFLERNGLHVEKLGVMLKP